MGGEGTCGGEGEGREGSGDCWEKAGKVVGTGGGDHGEGFEGRHGVPVHDERAAQRCVSEEQRQGQQQDGEEAAWATLFPVRQSGGEEDEGQGEGEHEPCGAGGCVCEAARAERVIGVCGMPWFACEQDREGVGHHAVAVFRACFAAAFLDPCHHLKQARQDERKEEGGGEQTGGDPWDHEADAFRTAGLPCRGCEGDIEGSEPVDVIEP